MRKEVGAGGRFDIFLDSGIHKSGIVLKFQISNGSSIKVVRTFFPVFKTPIFSWHGLNFHTSPFNAQTPLIARIA